VAGAVPPAVSLELHGRRCRIVCVDDVVPSHQPASGGSRLRERYRPDEIAHFSWGAHRYALVAEDEAPDDGHRTRDIHLLLTNRELQIVQLICTGLLTKQVSDRLRISEFTVRSYLKTIYCKLGVRSRGAMVYAYARSFARASSTEVDAP
jgi:DNA-binding NarL/FixJ family response regulator